MAIDWITEKVRSYTIIKNTHLQVYWTSGRTGRIYSAYQDGSGNMTTLLQGDSTMSLALDSCNGLMFFTVSGRTGFSSFTTY
jgi:hypothetical protein